MKTILTAMVLAAAASTASAQVDIYDLIILQELELSDRDMRQSSERSYQEMREETTYGDDRPGALERALSTPTYRHSHEPYYGRTVRGRYEELLNRYSQ